MNTETNERVAIKILDKEKIQKQNMGEQIKKAPRQRQKMAGRQTPAGLSGDASSATALSGARRCVGRRSP